MVKRKSRIRPIFFSIAAFVFILVVWELVTDVFGLMPPYMLPSPFGVAKAVIYKFSGGINPEGSTIYMHILTSLSIALGGFFMGAVIGVPLGVAMAWYKKVDLFAKPIFDLLRPIPPIAWIPIMILWFGIGYGTKAVIIFISSLIACVVNSYTGIKQTKDVHLWVARTYGASNLTQLFKVAIPTALPSIITGLKLSLGASWMALVAAELVASTKGLGYMIQMSRQMGRADIIIVGMFTIGIIGAGLSALIELISRKFVKGRNKR